MGPLHTTSERAGASQTGLAPGSTTAARDLELIGRALAGDSQAGELLAERLRVVPRLLHVLNDRAGGLLGEHELEDLAQDVLVVVWAKLEHFAGVGSLESWLYRFCQLELRNRLRKGARRSGPTSSADDLPSREGGTVEGFGGLEVHLAELGAPDEDVLRLKHHEGLSFEDVARALELPTSTVKARYYRGIRWLRRRLARTVEGER